MAPGPSSEGLGLLRCVSFIWLGLQCPGESLCIQILHTAYVHELDRERDTESASMSHSAPRSEMVFHSHGMAPFSRRVLPYLFNQRCEVSSSSVQIMRAIKQLRSLQLLVPYLTFCKLADTGGYTALTLLPFLFQHTDQVSGSRVKESIFQQYLIFC